MINFLKRLFVRPGPRERGQQDCLGIISVGGITAAEEHLANIEWLNWAGHDEAAEWNEAYLEGFRETLIRARSGADYIRQKTTTPGLEERS
jgi:hypothetical protein